MVSVRVLYLGENKERGSLMGATKSEIGRIASELYELLSKEELDEIKREVSKKRLSLRDFGDIE